MRISIFAFAILLGLAGCKAGKKATTATPPLPPPPMEAPKAVEIPGSPKPKIGDRLVFHYALVLQKPDGKDSMMMDTRKGGRPSQEKLRAVEPKDDIVTRTVLTTFPKISPGDSATFYIPVDSLPKQNLQPFMVGKLKWTLFLERIISKAEFRIDQEKVKFKIDSALINRKVQEGPLAKQDSIKIREYIKTKKINAKILPSGLYYIIETEGTGEAPLPYDLVSVHYKGYLLDGKPFDESYKRGEPISFPLGVGKVIAGWDQGLMQFKKGSKGKLLIPSYLGYGAQGSGEIPANAVLVFDVEMVDIK